ncbi:LysE family translocator [Pararhizobium sp.]|uniref:LysE family translocator n=1 Tax=Pararhizobium sp. TaxID=1977563 RepID=UPI002716E6D7|nr:LysE family translocator [Pararhizobium sp.]MDO9416639.1 LysE family translocator [Pararhizobium sp.]
MSAVSPYLPQLLIAWTAYFIAVVSPGPAILAIISTSISQGRRGGLSLAAGVLTGSYTWAMLTASGLSALIRTYGQAIVFLKIAGGCYLLWLAFNAARSALRKDEAVLASRKTPVPLTSLYLKGLGIHLTNPKAIFGWIMLVSIGMPAGAPTNVTVVFIGGCMIIGMIVFSGMALVFSLRPVNRAYVKGRRLIESAMAGFFAFAGVQLLTSRL